MLFLTYSFYPGIYHIAVVCTGQNLTIKVNYNKSMIEVCDPAPVNYSEIITALASNWPVLEEIEYAVQCDKKILKSDTVFNEDCTLKVVEICQGFSDFSELQALEYAKVEAINCTKNDGIFLPVIISDETIETVRLELLRRVAVFRRFNASENTMREFISVFLVGAVLFVNKDVTSPSELIEIIAENQIRGIRARGPVDYDLIFELFHICIAEAKKEKIEQGFYQNVAQMVACRDKYVYDTKKRKRDEPGVDYIQDIPSTGIVSTGDHWIFLKYMYEEGAWKIYRSEEIVVSLTQDVLKDKTQCFPSLKAVIGRIVGMLNDQKQLVSKLINLKKIRNL